MRLAVARLEHGHRRLVGMQHAALQQLCPHGVNQWLQLHATRATHCASVERGMARPARPKIASWRYSGRWSAYLATSTCASSQW